MRRFERFQDGGRNKFRRKPRETTTKNMYSKNPTFLLNNIKRICEEESDILPRLTRQIENFRELLSLNAQEEVFFWVMKVANKASNSSFLQMKSEIILSIWKDQTFIANFQSYLTSLPYVDKLSRKNNPSFWNDIEQFWTTFVTFCMFIIKFSPSVASIKCRCLLDVGNLCLNGLKSRCNIILLNDFNKTFNNLTKDLDEAMTVVNSKKNAEQSLSEQDLVSIGNKGVPNDFREIPILPTKSEIVDEAQPFLRPNIVNGAYSGIDHYLDVQFRLLREDCFKGLRDGIKTFIEDDKCGKYDYIRVYKNVNFLGLQVVNKKLGYLVQWQGRTGRKKYGNSKRFMFGSLLILSRDNFQNIILATVAERDEKLLSKGQIMVNIQDGNKSISQCLNSPFVMIESQVYFEPYYHVLKALQSRDFAENFPMKKYIVDAKPSVTPPSYLTDSTTYQVTDYQNEDSVLQIPVLDFSKWPQASSLKLNLSQYSAYQLALTREFVVIQGPPGTGKTYLGLMVARTLIENTTLIGPMLVICYTNHALDQFLEGLLNVTSNIVRIGGQSKNEKLDAFNLSNLRKSRHNFHSATYKEYMFKLIKITENVNRIQQDIQQMDEEIKFELFEDWLRPGNILKIDNVKTWLLGNIWCDIDVFSVSSIEQQIETQNEQIDDLQNKIHTHGQETSDWQIRNAQTTIYELDRRNKMLQELLELVKARLHRGPRGYNTVLLNRHTELNIMNEEERWALYFKFYKETKAQLWRELYNLETSYKETLKVYEELKLIEDRSLLEDSQVIGMTTTGAARLRELLLSLESPIVIVEEAAEVFEAHIVASLTRHCKHLILIGDHQQLRPSSACYEIGKHYGLEISLFERMIKNGLHCQTLQVQHRMRPEIASLIAPIIYKNLENHPSVEKFPNIRGVSSNVYFINHNHYEKNTDDEDMSRSNEHEANFLIKLAIYLRQQDYQPEDITILTTYNGQKFLMSDMQKHYDILKNVLITAVDNYQGEENKIILLSLVRSNREGAIGFLANENRVCVALSRAREGLFIIGNMDNLTKKSEVWKKINMTLKNQNSISNTLLLRCKNHVESVTEVTSITDFDKVPEGGCILTCDKILACGHVCRRICHSYDKNHEKFACQDSCTKILCDLGHQCPLKCREPCKKCVVKVPKDLPCGHSAHIECSMKPEDYKCMVQTDVVLPPCGHKNTKMCFMDDYSVPCKEPCIDRMPCGHACVNKCHKKDDPEHDKIACKKPCTKRKRGCTTERDDKKHMCKKMCFEECSPCLVAVSKKRTNCSHRVQTPCSENPDVTFHNKKCTHSFSDYGHPSTQPFALPCHCIVKITLTNNFCDRNVGIVCENEQTPDACTEQCEKSLMCGHPCKQKCGDLCDITLCDEMVPSTQESPCGHKFLVPCRISCKVVSEWELLAYCKEKCNELLECGHTCSGDCSSCSQGRIHVPCNEPCNRILLCGHKCTVSCSEFCPPCKKPCEVRCLHSKCSLRCFNICQHCVEPCKRRCPHRRCRRKCHMICSVDPCNEPCKKILRCGHNCRGLCGEECPDICNICKPESFPQDIIYLTPFDDDAKFIKLIDCPHSIEVVTLDTMMNLETDGSVKIHPCPLCKQPIINTPRYEKLIKTTFDNDIKQIKGRIQGNNIILKVEQHKLLERIYCLTEECESLCDHDSWFNVTGHILKYLKERTTNLTAINIEILQFSCYVVEILSKLMIKVKALSSCRVVDALNHEIEIIIKAIINIRYKLSAQQQNDVKRELRLLNLVTQCLQPKDAFSAVKLDENVLLDVIKMKPFDEAKAKELLKNFPPCTDYITIEEKNMIVRAMGLSQGHWFKCPNGHYYCITECGGAMQRSVCPECGAAIGGSSHRLLSSNHLATEMDGATRGAWPGGLY